MKGLSKQRPIYSRLISDNLALLVQAYCFNNGVHALNLALLLSTAVITVSTVGLSQRWPLTLPMAPFICLQFCRFAVESGSWMSLIIYLLSLLCFLVAVLLCVLFPTLQLAEIEGGYNLGAIDLFLPVADGSHVTARIYYPTNEKVGTIPYLRPDICSEYLKEVVAFGIPAPLNTISWLFDHWNLIRVPVKLGAQPIQDKERKLPLIVYSHGIAGSNAAYTYQIASQSARGNVVLAIDHTDGSAPVVAKHDGSLLHFDTKTVEFIYLDTSLGDGWKDKGYIQMCGTYYLQCS
jgi:hypothetical protein